MSRLLCSDTVEVWPISSRLGVALLARALFRRKRFALLAKHGLWQELGESLIETGIPHLLKVRTPGARRAGGAGAGVPLAAGPGSVLEPSPSPEGYLASAVLWRTISCSQAS